MELFERIKNEIKINIDAIKESIIDIAEAASNKTKKLRLIYKKSLYEKELTKGYAEIGIYFHKRQSHSVAIDECILNNMIMKIKEINASVDLINVKIEGLSSDISDLTVQELIKMIKKSGLLLRWLIFKGREERVLSELPFNDEIKIILISKDKNIFLPDTESRIKHGDRLIIIGTSDGIQSFIEKCSGIIESAI